MKQFLIHLFTGKDNATFDLGRVLWAIAFVVGICLVVYSVISQHPFNLTDYGVGVSGLLVAGAAALKLKETTEPDKHGNQ